MQQLKDADEHQWVKRDQAIWQFLSLTITIDPPRAAVGFFLIDQDSGNPVPVGEGIIFKNAAGVVIHLQPLPAAIYPSYQFVGMMSFMNSIATVEIIEEALTPTGRATVMITGFGFKARLDDLHRTRCRVERRLWSCQVACLSFAGGGERGKGLSGGRGEEGIFHE